MGQVAITAQDELSLSDMSAGLVKNGVPVVIALQELASSEAAVLWSTELYQNLVRNKPIEEAFTESRKEVFLASQHNISYLGQWFVPVLYKATELAEEIQPWYVQAENNIVRALRRLGTDRSLRGSAGLLALVITGTLMIQFLIEKVIPANPAGKELFLNRFNIFMSINPDNPVWLDYFLNVYLWLVGAAFLLVLGVTLWAYTDLLQEPILGKLERGGRPYLLMLAFIGANLGLLTGLTLSFMGFGLLLYYTGLIDLLPLWAQMFVRCLTGFICVVMMALFARRIPLSSRTASHNFKPVPAEIFIAASLFLVVGVLLFAILFAAPAIFLNQPLGGIFIGVVLFLLYLWESNKALRPARQQEGGAKESKPEA